MKRTGVLAFLSGVGSCAALLVLLGAANAGFHLEHAGRLDYLVNAAGVLLLHEDMSLLEIDLDVWDRVLAVTPPEALSPVRPLDDPAVPWLGLLTGVPLLTSTPGEPTSSWCRGCCRPRTSTTAAGGRSSPVSRPSQRTSMRSHSVINSGNSLDVTMIPNPSPQSRSMTRYNSAFAPTSTPRRRCR